MTGSMVEKRWGREMIVFKFLFAFVIALAALALQAAPEPAYADGGPHGGYQDTSGGLTDRCAACHRVHAGRSEGKLLKAESPYALCLSCHNGVGSYLNVLDGVKMSSLVSVSGLTSRGSVSDTLFISVAPYAETRASAGGNAAFTIRALNVGGSTTPAVTLTCANAGPETCTIMSSPGAVTAGNAAYGVVSVTVTSTVGMTTTTTITATAGVSATALVVKSTAESALADATLNGGGFRFVNGSPITSRHDADPAQGSNKPWGYGGAGVSSYMADAATATSNTGGDVNNLASPLQCTSCHNPHGTSNYRLLKESINGMVPRVRAWFTTTTATSVYTYTKDEGGRGLESITPTNKYVAEYYGSTSGPAANTTTNTVGYVVTGTYGIATLCGACHTAYPSEGASRSLIAPTSSGGQAEVHYRHRTEMPYTNWTNPETGLSPANPETDALSGFPTLRLASGISNTTYMTNTVVTCLTCHRAHGTASTMSGYALKSSLGGSADSDLSPAQTSTSTSMLLYTNNRGMCEACHRW